MDYKVTYLGYLKATAFVRVKDDAILYASEKEENTVCFAMGFCQAKDTKFYIE